MARIRSIKPEFFRNFKLYQAETESGLPLRVAFAGLWTAADREGRFRWVPEELKLDSLPHDQVDFDLVLSALQAGGWIQQYEFGGDIFGFIPEFTTHQVINNRESASKLPDPVKSNILTGESRRNHACVTREVHAQGEGKGKEGKGKEGNKSLPRTLDASRRVAKNSFKVSWEMFEEFWSIYPEKKGKKDAFRFAQRDFKTSEQWGELLASVPIYIADIQRIRDNGHPDRAYLHGSTYINGRWEDFKTAPELPDPEAGPVTDWDSLALQKRQEAL